MPADFEISPIIPPVEHQAPPATPARPVVPQQPAPVTPPTMPKSKSLHLLRWFILAAAVLFIASIAFLIWGGSSFSDQGVVITIDAPASASSGDEITYTVNYRNNTNVQLHDMNFQLLYPGDTVAIKNGHPQPTDGDSFSVASLNPGQSGSQQFQIFLVGDKGTIKTTQLNVVFQAGNLQSSFQKNIKSVTTIATLPVELTLVAPPTAITGQGIQYILDMRNDTGADLSNLRLQFTYPDGFTPKQFHPAPDSGNNQWNISTLSTSTGKRIEVDGVLTGNQQEAKTVSVVLQHQVNGQYVDYVQTQAFTMISSPLLSVSIIPNGSRDYISFAGDTINYVIKYANNSQYTLLGATLKVQLAGSMYNLSGIRVNNGSFDQSTNTVVFDSSGIPDFVQLSPGTSGQVSFSVPINTGFSGASGAKNFFVGATTTLTTPNIPSGISSDEVTATDSLVTKISSQPTLSAAVKYDGGEGSGPIPPKVGQTTTYTVHFYLTNPGNNVNNAQVTAMLPPGVSWQGGSAITGGTAPTYNKNTSQVTWSVGTLPFGAGTTSGTPKYEADFKVSINPSSNQVGQSVDLLGPATLTGVDSFTGQQIQSQTQKLSTFDVENHSADGTVTQ